MTLYMGLWFDVGETTIHAWTRRYDGEERINVSPTCKDLDRAGWHDGQTDRRTDKSAELAAGALSVCRSWITTSSPHHIDLLANAQKHRKQSLVVIYTRHFSPVA